jgi:hypothetical protein
LWFPNKQALGLAAQREARPRSQRRLEIALLSFEFISCSWSCALGRHSASTPDQHLPSPWVSCTHADCCVSRSQVPGVGPGITRWQGRSYARAFCSCVWERCAAQRALSRRRFPGLRERNAHAASSRVRGWTSLQGGQCSSIRRPSYTPPAYIVVAWGGRCVCWGVNVYFGAVLLW